MSLYYSADPFTSSVFSSECSQSTCSICRSELLIERIALYAQDVFINVRKMKEHATTVIEFALRHNYSSNFDDIVNDYARHSPEYYPTEYNDKMVNWLLVLNALNFSLWEPKSPTKQWTVNGLTGYKALCSAIKRAIDEGKPIWDANYISEITQTDIEIIFRSDDDETSIPFIHERARILREIGKVLLNKYEGTFRRCIGLCQGDSHRLLHLLCNEFESYRDKVIYKRYEVYIASKAVTLLCDLRIFQKVFINKRIMPSTMFADYRVPQVLLHMGILCYSNNLTTRFVENNEPLEHGSREELEIRCCSLLIGKMLVNEVSRLWQCDEKQMLPLNTTTIYFPILIDNFLWSYRDEMEDKQYDGIPYHNVRSVYY